MKIGIYGGSFNPCQLVHKNIVEGLLNDHTFDKIIIVPTGNYYKKSNLLSGEERIYMLNLMFSLDSRIEISDFEFKNNLICTYRSLDYFNSIYKDDSISLIIGSENLKQFDTWKKYEYILNTYNVVVVGRNHLDISKELEIFSKYDKEILLKQIDLPYISALQIRDYLLNDNPKVKEYLDQKVYDYIKEKGFYHKDFKAELIKDELTDEEFLKQYNPNSYLKLSVTTDITLFGVSDISKGNYRKIDQKAFSVLLVKRTRSPFKDKYCLPGGFLSLDETLVDCAKRVLATETNLEDIYLEQLYTFSGLERDIRGRVLSCCYMGLVNKNLIEQDLKSTASFFKISLIEEKNIISITLDDGKERFTCKAMKTYDSYGIETIQELENEYLAFDHLQMIITSIKRLQSKINYTDIVFHMMPKEFTLKELQLVYEAILDKKLLDPVFRRNIGDLVIKTNHIKSDGGHRPAALYKRKEE